MDGEYIRKKKRDEMMIAKAQWNDESEIVCYHGFQSFKHGEVTPEQAHEVGVKLPKRCGATGFKWWLPPT